MKELIFKLASTSRHTKVSFLILLDLCIFPVLLWLSYAIRQFDLGVDVIVGGHSHTFIEEPAIVNDIVIVQAAL